MYKSDPINPLIDLLITLRFFISTLEMTEVPWYIVIPWSCQSLFQTRYLRCHDLLVEFIDKNKLECKVSPSSHSVQAATSHCRSRPKQRLMLSECLSLLICDHTQSKEFRIEACGQSVWFLLQCAFTCVCESVYCAAHYKQAQAAAVQELSTFQSPTMD